MSGQEQPQSYILFYSTKCPESQKFVKLLQEYPEINNCCKKIAIEQLHPRQIPPQLTYVPGVVINKNQIVMGPNAFMWLKEIAKNCLSPGPNINSKGGFHETGFSFIGDAESEFSPDYALFGKEDANNGSAINPNDFDSRSGQPIHQNQSSSNNDLPPQLRPMKIENEAKLKDTDFNRLQQQRDNEIALPPRRS